ncbi:MAG TPA: hypothetical protein VI653_24045 [Steroidobacteraceae bacterium]
MSNASGRRWGRGGLAFGASLSLMGNVAHTCLVSSSVSLWLRLPLAIVWPVALFVGIEILVRVIWRRNLIDVAGRFLLILPVSTVAAVVSYQHLHALMRLAGEDGVAVLIGPLAVDGLMLGSTVALLAIRAAELLPTDSPDLDDVINRWLVGQDWDRAAEEELAPEMPVEAPVSPAVPPVERSPRAAWDQIRVAELAMAQVKAGEAHKLTGVGISTYCRWLRVALILKENPRAAIDKAERLTEAQVQLLRELATR